MALNMWNIITITGRVVKKIGVLFGKSLLLMVTTGKTHKLSLVGFMKTYNYRYLAVVTFTPGPMVEATVQERIY